MKKYLKANWYWYVEGDESQVWSSAAGGYVPITNTDFIAWSKDGTEPTKIGSLNDMLEIQIQVLEENGTGNRRFREAILGTDNGYMKKLDDKIAILRSEMTK